MKQYMDSIRFNSVEAKNVRIALQIYINEHSEDAEQRNIQIVKELIEYLEEIEKYIV